MLYPFVLTTLAGLATMIGTLPIFVKFNNQNKLIAGACSFAAGVMICVSVVDLIPEAIGYLRTNFNGFLVIILCFTFVMFGMFCANFIDKLVDKVSNDNNLFKIGILSMLVIILHNIPEGIVTFIVSNKNILLGLSICMAIALHNIPEGISIAIPIYYATGSKFRAIGYTLLSALSELVGAIITYLFLGKYINNIVLGLILSLTAGIMLAISFERLFPTGNNYDKHIAKIYFMIGFVFMIFTLLLNNLIS